jgi:hypothetical protein
VTPQPLVGQSGQPAQAPAANCHAAYPTVCIPPPSQDLDCGQIAFRRFTVLAPDPHRFDGSNNDGIGARPTRTGAPQGGHYLHIVVGVVVLS